MKIKNAFQYICKWLIFSEYVSHNDADKKKTDIYTPAYARSPITAEWTGGAGGRQMESQIKSC